MGASFMTQLETPGESTHETVSDVILHLPEKLHIPKFIGAMTNLILISLIIAGGVAYCLFKIDQKVNAMVATNKVIQEFALKNSAQTVLLKVVDEKLGANSSIQVKVALTNTINSLATIKKVPLYLICGLIEIESNWVPNLTSNANAKGLMQTLPSYSRPYLRNEKIEYNPNILFDPSVSAVVGINMLADFHNANVECGIEKEDDYTISLHNYFWGPSNTAILFGKKDGKYNVPNMAYPMRVLEAAKKYKELGL